VCPAVPVQEEEDTKAPRKGLARFLPQRRKVVATPEEVRALVLCFPCVYRMSSYCFGTFIGLYEDFCR
jgi:hypothetical protein